eukprot:gene11947-8222_t
MEVIEVACSGAMSWVIQHLTRKDLNFFCCFARDPVKAALDDSVFLDWRSSKNTMVRLRGQALILGIIGGVTARRWWRAASTAATCSSGGETGSVPVWRVFAALVAGKLLHSAMLVVLESVKAVPLYLGQVVEMRLCGTPMELIPEGFRSTRAGLLFFFLAPATEEIVFRGVHIDLLQQHHRDSVAIAVSAVVFTAAHAPGLVYQVCDNLRVVANENTIRQLNSPLPSAASPIVVEPRSTMCDTPKRPTDIHSFRRSAVTPAQLARTLRAAFVDLARNSIGIGMYGAVAGVLYVSLYKKQIVPLITLHVHLNMALSSMLMFFMSAEEEEEEEEEAPRPRAKAITAACYLTGVAAWAVLTFKCHNFFQTALRRLLPNRYTDLCT